MARDTYETTDELETRVRPDGLGNALVILTTILLLTAFIVVEKSIAKHYNGGMFSDPEQPVGVPQTKPK
jgi:hypothetical protein